MTHEEVRELIAAYAIDAIDPLEKARIDDHLIRCDSCRTTLREHQEAAGLLAFSAEPSIPSKGLRNRLLDEVVSSNGAPKTQRMPSARSSRRGLLVLVSVVVVILLLLFVFPRRFAGTGRIDPEITKILASNSVENTPLLPTRELPEASGQVFEPATGGSVAVIMRGLRNPGGQFYLIWLIVGDQAAPLGTVDYDPSGTAMVLVKKVPKNHEGFLVTLEETQDVKSPGNVVILRSLPPTSRT
jgi:hypothetical protein